MKRIVTIVLFILVITGAVVAWLVLGRGTAFSEKSRYFIIAETHTEKKAVLDTLDKEGLLASTTLFSWVASSIGTWDRIKPGKYEVKKGQSLLEVARMLKNGKQAEIRLVITKLRLKEDLAKLVGRHFSTDSAGVMRYLSSNDSLQSFGVDTGTVFSIIIPDTYIFYWNTPFPKILGKINYYSEQFWKRNNRIQKAKNKGLSLAEVYTLASIVEEETNYDSDKYKIASVYLNRLHKRMPLQACPTIKYAIRDFTITRIYEKYYVNNPSPYNTYRQRGLPPGPICTPSPKTIDIILDAPATDYLFFVAKSDFSGYHHFSSTYTEHNEYAKKYQHALDSYMLRKQNGK